MEIERDNMVINFVIFLLIIAAVVIRTVSYGIYCIKNGGTVGGISVFILAACSVATGIIIVVGEM